MTKVPSHPPPDLPLRRPDTRTWPINRPLWQIANSTGSYPRSFAELRGFGPLPGARFDPHPEPASAASGEQVAYAAATLLTAVAERFQHIRQIHRDDPVRPIVYAWRPTRELHLVDVTGPGAVRIGAAHSLNSVRKNIARRWARAIRAAWPDVDGLAYSSAMTGEDCVALWMPAADSFPTAPSISRGLDVAAPTWQHALRAIAASLGYDYY